MPTVRTSSAPPSLNFSLQADPQRCSESWKAWGAQYKDWKISSTSPSRPSISTPVVATYLYETIQSFGETELYSTCDGITRLRFKSPPTISKTTTVSVVQTWFRNSPDADIAAERAKTPPSFTATPPCRLKLSGDLCKQDTPLNEALFILEQKLGILREGSLFERDCPAGEEECDLDMNLEIVLLFWPHDIDSSQICSSNNAMTTSQAPHQLPKVVTMSEITFRGKDLYYRGMMIDNRTLLEPYTGGYAVRTFTSTLKGPFTFTSPTVYVAHQVC
jgi:hypothetical protein